MSHARLKHFFKCVISRLPCSARHRLIKSIYGNRPINSNVKDQIDGLLDKRKSIYTHIPKTGGTSLNHILFKSDIAGHTGLLQVMAMVDPEGFNEAFKFAFVRNPFDRFVSTFKHLDRGGWNTDHDAEFYDEYGSYIEEGFAGFVKLMKKKGPYIHVVSIPQHEFICLGNKLIVDFVGRFERIDSDFGYICTKLGIEAELPKLNMGNSQSWESFYDENSMKVVQDIYKKDFEIFKYPKYFKIHG